MARKPIYPDAGIAPRPAPDQIWEGLDQRSREIMRMIVDAYVESGDPIGSRTISRRLGGGLSPASIRNIMADLEDCGLLYAPHTSAGRLPTGIGLKLFVDGLIQTGGIDAAEQEKITAACKAAGHLLPDMLQQVSTTLSGLSGCVSLVVAPKDESPLKHIELIRLGEQRALAVLVTESGLVENRILDLPRGLSESSLVAASNYLTARMVGRTLAEAREEILLEIQEGRALLDTLAEEIVSAGIARRVETGNEPLLIVTGRQHLVEDTARLESIGQIRSILEVLEQKETMLSVLEAVSTGEGVKIYIGADNDLFDLSGFSLIMSAFRNQHEKVIGAIGVIGPTRIRYARIIPAVDFTARVISHLAARGESG